MSASGCKYRAAFMTCRASLFSGERQLNGGNPIVAADGSPIAYGCNGFNTHFLDDEGAWQSTYEDGDGVQRPIDAFHATAHVRQIKNCGKYLAKYCGCHDYGFSIRAW